MAHRYAAFGLLIETDFPLPALAGAGTSPHGPADVRIVEGAVPASPDPEWMRGMSMGMAGELLVVGFEGVGRFGIAPDRITVEREPAASEAEVMSFLLGSALGGLLHRRRLLPFHSNAVVVDGRAFLFCGASGAGKSTLAAHFLQAGLPLLTDDLCAIRPAAGGGFEALPGIPRLKLWQESIDLLGMREAPRTLLPWSDDKYEIVRESASTSAVPVAAIYHLLIADAGEDPGIAPVGTLAALNAITANIYRRRLADIAGESYYLRTAAELARLPVFAVRRRWGLDHFAAEAAAVEAHIRA